MILLKYSEPQWIPLAFFGIVILAFIISQVIATRPKDEEEKRLMKIYQQTNCPHANEGNKLSNS